MRNVTAISVVVVVVVSLMITTGCSNKPPRDVDAAARQRLARFSQAWEQGDAPGVRDSLYARDAGEAALAEAVAALAPAQATLRAAYQEALGPLERVLFGDGEPSALVVGAGRWASFARSAAHPHQLTYSRKPPLVTARLEEGDDDDEALRLRKVDGDWKIETISLVPGDDVERIAAAARRQLRHTQDITDAVRSRDRSRIQQVMIRQLVEVRGPARQARDDAAAATATTRAKENPP